ncbi:MAG: FHA domain-containing protein [Planctomycetes bacterium]|jgi:pSer/pThr/pTyr-binding forkhead associated (FHA) protein|nr:FHA domain-containing protein [Planctomycetota bacterium]
MASIIVTSGEQTGEFLPLGRRTSVIGRGEALPLQVLDDFVSRRHLRIRFDETAEGYYAEDMVSKHGTFVNQRRITTSVPLSDGDVIRIGQTTLLFTNEDFDDRESALEHYKKFGEKARTTRKQ